MSEYIKVSDHPSLSEEHLEILPNLTVQLQYQDVLLKCFHPSVTNIETGFKMSYLEDLIQISCNLSFQLVVLMEDNFGVLAFFFGSENGLSGFSTL